MNSSRRSFLRGLASAAGVATTASAHAQHVHPPSTAGPPPSATRVDPRAARGVIPVVSPDIPDMPWRMERGVKVFDIEVGLAQSEFVGETAARGDRLL